MKKVEYKEEKRNIKELAKKKVQIEKGKKVLIENGNKSPNRTGKK